MLKNYIVFVDGLKVGILELTAADVTALASDPDIKIKEVK